ncbi:MAG: hypothetical protein ACI8YI_002573, partial [Paracoccaceae bacterium]
CFQAEIIVAPQKTSCKQSRKLGALCVHENLFDHLLSWDSEWRRITRKSCLLSSINCGPIA